MDTNNYHVDSKGYYGCFGGAYVPEILRRAVETLQENYLPIMQSESFRREYDRLLRDYVGRPSPLYLAKRLSERYGCRIYLKREDLNHTGAHKINNTIGQILIARRMGMPSMTETMGGAMGRTVIIVVAWIGSVVFALVALFALAAVFAPLIGLATI